MTGTTIPTLIISTRTNANRTGHIRREVSSAGRAVGRLALVAVLGALAVTGLAHAGAAVAPDDYASPARLQTGHGPASTLSTTSTASAGSTTGTTELVYGSAGLIQLGSGPGGPS